MAVGSTVKLSTLEKDLIFRDNLVWLLFAQAVCILPLLVRLPIWIWLVWLFALLWRVQIHRARWRFPSFWLKLILGIVTAAGIYLTYHGVAGVEPMIGFLVCSFILKVIEMRTKKDALIVLFIGFIAVAAQFLFAQNLVAGFYGLFSLFFLLSAWTAAFISQPLTLRKHFLRGWVFLLQSLPFMLILFVVMPRLGPLWSVPLPEGEGRTGFSESLQLGDIGNLVKSPDVAFRVKFNSQAPDVNTMYWRGLILDYYDGRVWRVGFRPHAVESVRDNDAVAEFDFSVVMEPHYYRWLFSLGVPVSASSTQLTLQKNDQGLLISRKPVSNKAEYRVRSRAVSSGQPQKLTEIEEKTSTQLPSGVNPLTRKLAADWLSQGLEPRAFVQRAIGFFSNDFSYTLQPTVLGENAVDEFLFETRAGFCEHFASSFVFLMRSAGIPARIVVGYQGGEINEVEGYFVVRQSDAHAWAEVWLADSGWLSIDPTGVVAPSRIELGLNDALSDGDRELVGRSAWRNRMLQRMYQRFDAMEYSWNRWVLNYDNESQDGLFKRLLGINSPWRVGAMFAFLSALFALVYLVINRLLKLPPKTSKEYALLKPLLRRMEKHGIKLNAHETLFQLAKRIERDQPQLSQLLVEVDIWYRRAAYADEVTAVHHLAEKLQVAMKHCK